MNTADVWLQYMDGPRLVRRLYPSEEAARAAFAERNQSPYREWWGEATAMEVIPLQPCLDHFTWLVQRHDLTFCMSDDGEVCRRGQASLNRIRALAAHLPLADVQRIWNARVDAAIRPDEAPRWYWRA